jgi:hypothetical protein
MKGASWRRNDAKQLGTEGAGSTDGAILLAANGTVTSTGTENDAAKPLVTNGEPRMENAVESGAQGKGVEMTDSALESESIVDTMLENVQLHTPAELWTSMDNKVKVDLPLVASLVGCRSNPDQLAASTVLAYIEKKQSWNLGNIGMIWQRLPESVPLMHKAERLLQLKGRIYAILKEWMNETPPLSPKQLEYPKDWPLDHPDATARDTAPSATREWATRLLSAEGIANTIPLPARQASDSTPACHSTT